MAVYSTNETVLFASTKCLVVPLLGLMKDSSQVNGSYIRTATKHYDESSYVKERERKFTADGQSTVHHGVLRTPVPGTQSDPLALLRSVLMRRAFGSF